MADGAFDTLMSSKAPTPLVVLTTAAENEPARCLVGFHVQSSTSPQQYRVWLSKANHTYRVSLRATHFALHFLTQDDLAVAGRFGTLTGDDTDKLTGMEVLVDQRGVPLLQGCPHRLSLERIAVLDVGGDHVCLTTAVTAAHGGEGFVPLRASAAAHLEPGHRSDERAVHP